MGIVYVHIWLQKTPQKEIPWHKIVGTGEPFVVATHWDTLRKLFDQCVVRGPIPSKLIILNIYTFQLGQNYSENIHLQRSSFIVIAIPTLSFRARWFLKSKTHLTPSWVKDASNVPQTLENSQYLKCNSFDYSHNHWGENTLSLRKKVLFVKISFSAYRFKIHWANCSLSPWSAGFSSWVP